MSHPAVLKARERMETEPLPDRREGVALVRELEMSRSHDVPADQQLNEWDFYRTCAGCPEHDQTHLDEVSALMSLIGEKVFNLTTKES